MNENTQKKRRKGLKPLKSCNIVFNSIWEEASMRAWNSTSECPKADAISFGSPQRQRPSGIIIPMWSSAYYEQERRLHESITDLLKIQGSSVKESHMQNRNSKEDVSVLSIPIIPVASLICLRGWPANGLAEPRLWLSDPGADTVNHWAKSRVSDINWKGVLFA